MKNLLKIIVIIFLSIGFIAIIQCCTKPSAPTVKTATVTDITAISAVSGGNVTNNGGEEVTERGVCWGTTQNPTTSSSKISNGTGNGPFTCSLTQLTSTTLYHIRAYAINSVGTAYGDDLTFTTTAIISTVPGAPTIGTAIAGNTQALVAFTAPASDGGSAITGYTATSSPGGLTGAGTASPITVTGLTNGIAYTFIITATNANGAGPASSASNSVTPSPASTVPGAPIIGTATAGNAQASITFTAPANNGGSAITSYTVTSSPGGLTGAGNASPVTVTGLTNGIAYTFTVTATNLGGTGPASSASNSVTPAPTLTVPGAPAIGTATAGNAQASITFTVPANNGGSAITSYSVTSSPGGFTVTGSASPITVTGLTNGTVYTFTVTAINAIGKGPASVASNSVTPSTVPDAPTIGTATKGDAQATVTFTVPGSNGGSAITSYTVTSNPGGFTANGTTSPITVTGLTNGTAYTFTVTASNINGMGPASAVSNSVTPLTVPGAPTIGTVTKGNAQATIAFTAPGSNGGSVITSYTVTSNPGNFAVTASSSPITVTGLTNGTVYTFTVTATNANGTGTASAASNPVTPSTVPGAPTSVLATKGNAQATVTFLAPVNNGGSSITGYTVTSNPGGLTATVLASPGIVTGLTNGLSYTFTVTASNVNGPGQASIASNLITLEIAVGSIYQGGIVAYILQSGDNGYTAGQIHGIIAAPSDQSTGAEWGCNGIILTGADGTSIGTGNQNTIDIVNGCTTAGTAAKICYDLVLNGYNDWYLPSKDELNEIYKNQAFIGGFASANYWSSSENSSTLAWRLALLSGTIYGGDKYALVHVRAVRSF